MSDDVKWIQDRHRVLSGKRRAPRRRRSLTVRLLGPGGVKYAARTVDVSRGGMLAEITDGDFLPFGDRADLLPFAARVATVFPQGMDVFFGDGAVQVHADVVRLVTRPGDTVLLLGCRFQPELTDFDCRLLGVETAGDETGDETDAVHEGDPAAQSTSAMPATQATGAAASAPGAPAPVPPAAEPKLAPRPSPAMRPAAAGPGFQLAEDPTARGRRQGAPAQGPLVQRSNAPAPRPTARPTPAAASAPLAMPPASAPPTPAPTPATPYGAADFAPRAGTGSDSRVLSSRIAGPGVVLAHLFPLCGTLFGFGSRFAAKVVDLDDRRVVLEVLVPDDEPDPIAYAAGLGADTRAVVLQDGRVLWETRFVVDRLLDGSDRTTVRVEGHAVRPPTPLMRRAFAAPLAA